MAALNIYVRERLLVVCSRETGDGVNAGGAEFQDGQTWEVHVSTHTHARTHTQTHGGRRDATEAVSPVRRVVITVSYPNYTLPASL